MAAGPAQALRGNQCAMSEGTRQSQAHELLDQGNKQLERLRIINNLYKAGRFSYTEARQRIDAEASRGKEILALASHLNNTDPEEAMVDASSTTALREGPAVAVQQEQGGSGSQTTSATAVPCPTEA